jgi:hypothetical protein
MDLHQKNAYPVPDINLALLPRCLKAASPISLAILELAQKQNRKIFCYYDRVNPPPGLTLLRECIPSAPIKLVAVDDETLLPRLKTRHELHLFFSNLVVHNRENKALFFPQQISKLQQDETTIESMVSTDVKKLKMHLSSDRRLATDPRTLLLLTAFASSVGFSGRVLDYGDSAQLLGRGSRHLIFSRPLISLTSFVGIAFHKRTRQTSENLTGFDVDFLLGILKSHIIRDLNRKRYKFKIPCWHPICKRHQGIAVATHLNSEPYCESLELEDGKRHTGELFLAACAACVCPSRRRWHRPGSCLELKRYLFSIEFIEQKSLWRAYAGHRALGVLNLGCKKSGACLELSNEEYAVFLPSKKSSFWESRQFVASLERAAKGSNSSVDWKMGRLFLFTTRRYVWKR